MDSTGQEYKAGFVAVVGRPNVGKSTLLNTLLGQVVAAVSKHPQMTRRQQLGILTLENGQIVFMDTPGLHKPHHKLGEYMNEIARIAMLDADVLLWIVDASLPPHPEDLLVGELLETYRLVGHTILVLNKTDQLPGSQREKRTTAYLSLAPEAFPILVSATTGQGTDLLLKEILLRLPPGPQLYETEQVTDLYEREITADLIRQACMENLREELPHSIAIRVDEYSERGENAAHITATIFVEKESQKGIAIGQGGDMIKKIGSAARKEIETMSGRKVYLELRVKVNKSWRNNPDALRLLGYQTAKNE